MIRSTFATPPVLRLLPALLVAALAGGCAKKTAPPAQSIPVSVATAERRSVPFVLDATGTVEPVQRVSVESQVSGQLMRVAFREGDEVQKGQILFQIDPRPFQSALRQAEAVLARDEAQATNAVRDAERYAALAQKEYVTTQQYDQARANAAALQATVAADRAAVETVQLNLQHATIRAPIGGRAGSLMLREGNLVSGPGTVLVTINQLRPILVRFTIPSRYLGELRRRPNELGIAVQPQGGGPTVTGRLAFVDNTVDTATGNVLLKGEFANRDGALWPGAFLNTRLQLYVDHDVVTVPAVAVTSGQAGDAVFVIQNGTAASRPVTVIRTTGDVAIIGKGLQPGEQVVTDGQLRLTPGAKVEIRAAPGRAPQEAT